MRVWVLEYQHGWGTRGERSFSQWLFDREPTVDEAVDVLRAQLRRDASKEWFEPQNSGLVEIREVKFTPLPPLAPEGQ